MTIAGVLKRVAKQTSVDREKQLSKIQSEAMPLVDVAQTEASRLAAAKKAAAPKAAAGKAAAESSGAAASKKKIMVKSHKPRSKQMVPNPHKRKPDVADDEEEEAEEDPEAVENIPLAQRRAKKRKVQSVSGSQKSPSERSRTPVDHGSRDELLEVVHVEGEAQKSKDGGASVDQDDSASQNDFWDFGQMPDEPVTPMPKRYRDLCHLKPEFMGSPSAPGWCADVSTSISAVPPLLGMAGEWSPEARRAIGAGLARRVTPELFYPTRPEGEKALEAAIAELGFYAHAASTCMHTALEAVRYGKRREETLMDKVRSSSEVEKSAEKFQQVADEIKTQMKEIGKQVAGKDEVLKKLELEVKQLKSSLSIKVKAAKTELEAVRQQAADDVAAARAEAQAEAKAAYDKVVADRDSYKSRYHKAKDAYKTLKAGVAEQVAAGVKAHTESDEFEASVQACFYKGINHSARCFLNATAKGKEVNWESFATFAKTDSFSRKLAKYHGLVPYLEGEVEEYNEWAAEKGYAQVTGLPPIEAVNLNTLMETAVVSDDDEEVAEEQTGVEDVAEEGVTGQDKQGITAVEKELAAQGDGEKVAAGVDTGVAAEKSTTEEAPAVDKDGAGAVLEKDQVAGAGDA